MKTNPIQLQHDSNKYKELINLMKNYNILAVKDIIKVRSVYKIITDSRCYCIKESNHNIKKFKWLPHFISYLKSNNFLNCLNIIHDKFGNYYFKHNSKKAYYLTDWIDARECNIDDFTEALKSMELLADFHIKARGFNSKYINKTDYRIIQDFTTKISDLIYFKELLYNKKIKTKFEIDYLNEIDTQLYIANEALNLIKNSNYINYNKICISNKSIAHNSFYYQNILISSENNYYLIDYDKIVYECKEYDIGKFIQRLMYRKHYGWDFDKAHLLLNHYSSVYPIDKTGYYIILSLIIFPHKFWKLGDKRFNKNKCLDEKYYLKRLVKIKKYNQQIETFKQNFINKYLKE